MVAHHLRIFVRKVVVTIQVPMDTLTMLLAQGVDVYMGFAKVDFALTVRVEVNCRAHTMLVREVDVNIPAAFLENVGPVHFLPDSAAHTANMTRAREAERTRQQSFYSAAI